MTLKIYKPITPGTRHRIIIVNKMLTTKQQIKNLQLKFCNTGGRNIKGRITIKHQSAGMKKIYRIIDFKRNLNMLAIVKRLEYDPYRTAFLALICYFNSMLSYIIAPHNLKSGDYLNESNEIKIGNTLALYFIPLGTLIHNIEVKPLNGGKYIRAAGTFAQLLKKNKKGFSLIRFCSGEYRLIALSCYCTIGTVSNFEYIKRVIGKAGISRKLGIRPKVRGVAMNPVDHPHGGRTKGGRQSVNFLGHSYKGKPTRNPRLKNKLIIPIKKKN